MCSLMEMSNVLASAPVVQRFVGLTTTSHVVAGPPMDTVMVFGFFCGFVALVSWMYQSESNAFTLGFSAGLAGLAVYGFLEGFWPLGIVQGIWSATIFQRWREQRKKGEKKRSSFYRRRTTWRAPRRW